MISLIQAAAIRLDAADVGEIDGVRGPRIHDAVLSLGLDPDGGLFQLLGQVETKLAARFPAEFDAPDGPLPLQLGIDDVSRVIGRDLREPEDLRKLPALRADAPTSRSSPSPPHR